MMIATTCLVITLMILNHGQVGNFYVVTVPQATESSRSGTPRSEMNDRLEFDEGSGIMETMINVDECPGNGFPRFTISLPNPSGCYIFQTTGFNMEGYPNNSLDPFPSYACAYIIEFGATVSGTLTVKENDFQFQGPNSGGNCVDFVYILGVNDEQQEIDNSDSDDQESEDNALEYCGTITGDKIRDFSNTKLTITLVADNTENGNGAEIVICID